MSNEKERIINMLDEGKINAEDAAKLLGALGDNSESGEPKPKVSDNPALRGKKLRVNVDIKGEDREKVDVNIALPLALAKVASGIITNVIPKEVNKELEAEGINLGALNLGEIVDALTDTDEDIINVDIDGDGGEKVKVKVYVL
jgi:hypothetical protein